MYQLSQDLKGGNKTVYKGPRGGRYIIVRCNGKKVKRYIK